MEHPAPNQWNKMASRTCKKSWKDSTTCAICYGPVYRPTFTRCVHLACADAFAAGCRRRRWWMTTRAAVRMPGRWHLHVVQLKLLGRSMHRACFAAFLGQPISVCGRIVIEEKQGEKSRCQLLPARFLVFFAQTAWSHLYPGL